MAEVGRESWVERVRVRWLDWLVAAVLLGLFGVAVGGSRAAFTGSAFPLPWQPWWDGFLQNSGTEMLGAFLTFVLLELVRGRRERKAQEDAEERRMEATHQLVRSILQAQDIARLRAAKTPEERQPILDSMKVTGLLQGANLAGINLQRANLTNADLQEARLDRANLHRASLDDANLQGASLSEADLEGAHLNKANLQRASLRQANLRGAKALLVEQLRQAEYLEGAILPDGKALPGRTLQGFLYGLQEAPWREAFEAWCETVVTEAYGWIRPADLPPADPDDE